MLHTMKDTSISFELMPPLNLTSARCKITINYIWIYQQPQYHSEKSRKTNKKENHTSVEDSDDNLTKLSD